MAILGNCENGPLSPMGWATGPLWPPVAKTTGDRDLSIIFFLQTGPWRGTWCRGAGRPPNGGQGGMSPPPGDKAGLPYLNPPPLSPLILFSKISEKIEKRREG